MIFNMQQKYLHAWNRKRHKCFHRQLDRDATTKSGGEKYEGIGTRGVGGRPRSPAPVAARRLRETAFACGGVRPSVRPSVPTVSQTVWFGVLLQKRRRRRHRREGGKGVILPLFAKRRWRGGGRKRANFQKENFFAQRAALYTH